MAEGTEVNKGCGGCSKCLPHTPFAMTIVDEWGVRTIEPDFIIPIRVDEDKVDLCGHAEVTRMENEDLNDWFAIGFLGLLGIVIVIVLALTTNLFPF